MLRDKMLALICELNDLIAERAELIECIAIALLALLNLFILGDTGQAKSYALNQFRKRITGAIQFERLLSKQTDEESLFGRIDLSTMIPGNADEKVLEGDSYYQELLCQLRDLTTNNPDDMDNLDTILKKLEFRRKASYMLHGNKPKLNTMGYIPEAHIVFLDELFKCNDGVLNSLLTVSNERKFTNEGEIMNIPAISFMGASNEIPNFSNPDDRALRHLFDRFHIKVVTQYIQNRESRQRMLSRKQHGQAEQISSTITLEELYAMQREVASVTIPDDINELADDILCELRKLEIHISDRKFIEYGPLVQAKAWLNGRNVVQEADLDVLKFYFWTKPEEIPVIQQVLDKLCVNPLQEELNEILSMADEISQGFNASIAANPRNSTKAMNKLRGELKRLYHTLNGMNADTSDPEDKAAISKTMDDIEDISREAHEESGFTYEPLSKLYNF